jgi:amino-acid N-acetyltransferase
MAQLYLDEYLKTLAGRRVSIACREGILRDNFSDIVADVKFLNRHGIATSLFHNLPHRQANRKLLGKLEGRLPSTSLIRISADVDFYEAVLADPATDFKLIFLERRYLCDAGGKKINTLTTRKLRESRMAFAEGIGNVNFRDAISQICESIEAGHCQRIHILPAAKNSIKHELFTVEGSGTMVANNFTEQFRQLRGEDEVAIVNRILSMYKKAGFLRPRSREYVSRNRQRFYVTAIDDIIVGCVEQKVVDERTIELGALAISTRFVNQRVGVYTVNSFIETMRAEGYSRFISLTLNPRLQALFIGLGFASCTTDDYRQRQNQSPGVPMFFKCF